MLTRHVVAVSLASVALLSSCQEDLTAQKADWDSMQKEWSTKTEKTRKAHTDLVAKAKAFTLPAGEEAAFATEKTALDTATAETDKAIAEADKAIGEAKGTIEGLIAKGKRVPVEVALSNTKRTVDGLLGRADSLVSAASENFDLLGKKAAQVKAEGDAAKSRAEAWAGEVKKKGGMLSIDDIVFNGEALVADKSRVALTALVPTLKACPELRVELTVAARGEGDLGSKRADTLKAWLAEKVDAAVLSKVSGSAAADAEEKVGVSVTTPCK